MTKYLKPAGIAVVLLPLFLGFQNCSKNQLNLVKSESTGEDSGMVELFSATTSKLADGSAPEKFKIIWHIGPNSESLVRAPDDDRRIARIKSKVDGYYFLVLSNSSLLTYWPERPLECRMNFRNLENLNADVEGDPEHFVRLEGIQYGALNEEKCRVQFDLDRHKRYDAAVLESKANGQEPLKYGAFSTELHESALRNVLQKLKIQEEQAAGKTVMSEMILISADRQSGVGDFSYDAAKDEIILKDLPKSYDFLLANGVRLDRGMTYQEPRTQGLPTNGALLRVPLNPGEDTSWYIGEKGQPCNFCLPDNLRMIGMLTKAFQNAQQRTPKMAINIRSWTRKHEAIVEYGKTDAFNRFGGINIEGSERKMDKESYESTIAGAAFVLQKTNYPVSLLMPGSLDNVDAQTNLQVDRDKYALDNMINYIKIFNADLSAQMNLPAGQNAICNDRFSLIVGGYGAPLHMEPLPLFRRDSTGKLTNPAGTTGMQILVLERYRAKLCGVEPVAVEPPSTEVSGYIKDIFQSCTDSECN